jgi:hypothetical protein
MKNDEKNEVYLCAWNIHRDSINHKTEWSSRKISYYVCGGESISVKLNKVLEDWK